MLKNMLLYRILDPHHVALLNDWGELATALAEVPAKLPTGSQWVTIGFDKPASQISEELVWSGSGVNLFTIVIHERQLPGATIRDHVQERVNKIETREMRKCYRKEIAQIKDDVVAALLPKAFIKHSAINMLVIDDLLVIGASSAKKAEDCLVTLRQALGVLSVRPLTLKTPADTWLTDLMRSTDTDDEETNRGPFTLLDVAKLANSTKDTVTFKGVDLDDTEPQLYLGQGFFVQELGLALKGEFYFKVTSQLIFKGLKFSDMQLEQVASDAAGDPGANLDGTLVILVSAIKDLVQAMVDRVGEEVFEKSSTPEWDGDDDSLLEAAQEYLLHRIGNPSISVLQRKFRIGFNRAERIMDTLETMGVVTPVDADGVREIIATGNYEPPENLGNLDDLVSAANAYMEKFGAKSTTEELDEFGDPVEPEQEDDDL